MQAQTVKVRVDALREEAHGVRSFSVSRIDGAPFEPYEPGAHIDVTGPSGVTRQYSLCGDPACLRTQIFAVKKEAQSRGGSRSLHEEVTVGSELSVGAPRSLFQLHAAASEHILIGAGIGITPLLSMAYRLVASNARFTLHYFARSEAHAAFMTLLTRAPFNAYVKLHFGVERHEQRDKLDECIRDAGPNAHVYTCGPSAFMDAVVETAQARLPADAIHLERFKAEPIATAEASLDSFEVQLASSGQTVRVDKSTSIVDALASIGIEVDTSCGEGVCGTCMVDVVSGEPEHRDHCLSKAERASNSVICCCVSRSRSPVLVLDL
ncbi:MULTISPECIES: PDR/VanB family oxidoreductase [Caballeronia]|uniref:Ferredoxin n=1 Tax=Caballeronia zhejiangensis TaxID=871203 RepID=A0A656QW80_9BURK|nr:MULTISPECIES: PDR/VanB family oxidoreductase [Caballeronia]EKS71013.1 ferredoxin [Burkholderia sp. SJ98]KDR34038.1 ferredoxin [Caballeronia zhejiangensis]MCG7404650.1 PDR/VanB family oxidoreductase [Caballeronia zhejiangensis]MCI1044076.1 oxidoreductase [Caballeronia zhejiangensis]MDR5769777.1 PDR/VanB family oxidoreductase [Caballeronia sp. LZ028]